MSLIDQIDRETIEALKAGDKQRVTVLRGLKSDLKYRRIEKGDDLTDEDVIQVLSSAAKKRRDSIEQFTKGGRSDLVEKEQFELDLINVYLPQPLSEEKIKEIILAAVSETGAQSPRQIGDVMKVVMPRLKGKADGKLVNKLVMEVLAK